MMFIAWQMETELWRSRNEQVKKKLFGAAEPCVLGQSLEARKMDFELYAVVTKKPLGVVGDHIVQASLTISQWEVHLHSAILLEP